MKKQIIGLDLKAFSLKNAGIGRYSLNLTQNLIKRGSFSYVNFLGPNSAIEYLPKMNTIIANGISTRFNSTILRSLLLLPFELQKKKIELFHSMDSSTVNLLPRSSCKRLTTIHDVIVFKYPQFFTRKHTQVVKRMLSFSARKADHIITDSLSTKYDLLEIFPFLDEKEITVIYLAASEIFQECPQELVQKFIVDNKLPKRYFLSLATYEPRKNLKNLISAFRLLRKNSAYEDIGLVLAGGEGWLDSGIAKLAEINKKDNIVSLGFVPDELLPLLYSGTLAFVYPSFYEGFGLPILEAMSCGRPAITSLNSSLPEVADNSALYIDPNSVESIKNALREIADDSNLREKLAKQALLRSKNFNWKKTASQTEKVYRNLLDR